MDGSYEGGEISDLVKETLSTKKFSQISGEAFKLADWGTLSIELIVLKTTRGLLQWDEIISEKMFLLFSFNSDLITRPTAFQHDIGHLMLLPPVLALLLAHLEE